MLQCALSGLVLCNSIASFVFGLEAGRLLLLGVEDADLDEKSGTFS